MQWFPEFMGTRIQLNAQTDPNRSVLSRTYGDYATSDSDRNTNVWQQDFYYWPYVDGFPGYSYFYGWEWDYSQLGVVGEDTSTNSGTLYSPFYLAPNIENFRQEDIGPKSEAQARATVLSLAGRLVDGGVDVSGGTPWRSVVGSITGSPPQSNAPFSHSTVASYLRFSQNVSADGLCVPHAAVLITDGDPDPVSTEGGSGLHSRLSQLRTELGAKVYVVGFVHASRSLQNMACAAAGSDNSSSPCVGNPANEWDTCANPSDPVNGCAFLASSSDALAAVLVGIVKGMLALDVPAGPTAFLNEFPSSGSGSPLQTKLTAYTEWPGWRGHVVRGLCTDVDPDDEDSLADHCVDDGSIGLDGPSFGPCPLGRSWDAGTCLQRTNWFDRRIYVNRADGSTFQITNDDGTASDEFLAALNDGALDIPGSPFDASAADDIAAFILGDGWPDAWKLPGLANSAPVLVRRIPPYRADASPSVAIRGAHCAGRKLSRTESLPTSLAKFAADAWSEDLLLDEPEPHHAYQEAAIVGDDLGIVHAFHLDSGNELWGLLPRHLLRSAVAQYREGTTNRGQPSDMDNHHYGIAATANQGWVYDPNADDGDGSWRHLLVVGNGIGGNHLMALDVSHISPYAEQGPIELLWSTSESALADDYVSLLGETWSRPTLTYRVSNDLLNAEPTSRLVFGAGYASDDANGRGRTIVVADALTGAVIETAELPAPDDDDVYDPDFAAVTDVAVGSHCISRFWAESQEAYIADPVGRLYRWDLGRDTDHAADSGATWSGEAIALATLPACAGTGDSCTIAASHRGDPFLLAPAVSALNRIDDEPAKSGVFEANERDQFLVALASGSVYDDATDGSSNDNDLHASIYLLVDDHREDKPAGLEVPDGAPATEAGDNAHFFRLPLSQIERTRVFQPVPGGETFEETRTFRRSARPLRSPRIRVTGAYANDNAETPLDGIEVVYVEYFIYEPGDSACDGDWFDEATGEWVFDQGSTYIIRLRLTVNESTGFDFENGSGHTLEDRYGFSTAGLEMGAVEQVLAGNCQDGVCSPQLDAGGVRPCTGSESAASDGAVRSIPLSWAELDGFSPLEIE